MLIKILACLVMLAIAYQDFKYRAIHWLLFLLICVLFIIDALTSMSLIQYAKNVYYNLILIVFQLTLLYLFYVIKGRNLKSILNKIIGTGDVLFILLLSLFFSWHSFLFYYIGGLVFSIIIWLLLKHLLIIEEEFVPFAGLMAVFCILIIIIELILPVYDRFNDSIFKLIIYG